MPRTTQPGLSPYITWQGNSLHTIFSQQVHKFHTHQYHCICRWRAGVCGRHVSQQVSMKISTHRCVLTVQLGLGDIVSNVCSSRIEFGCFLQNVSLWQMPFDAIQLIARWPHDAHTHTQVIFSYIFFYLCGSFFLQNLHQFPVFCSKIPGEKTASKWWYFCTFDSLHDLFPSCWRDLGKKRALQKTCDVNVRALDPVFALRMANGCVEGVVLEFWEIAWIAANIYHLRSGFGVARRKGQAILSTECCFHLSHKVRYEPTQWFSSRTQASPTSNFSYFLSVFLLFAFAFSATCGWYLFRVVLRCSFPRFWSV